MGVDLLEFVALFVTVIFLAYVAMIVLPFMRRPRTQPGNPGDFDWHFLIPARDEASVIVSTLERCRSDFPAAHVWVVDDASTDATAQLVVDVAARDPQVHLVRRFLPDARAGKGSALNAGYHALDDWLTIDADRTRTVVAVLDADGRLAGDALRYVSSDSVFGNPAVGAAQIGVRMENRDDLGAFVAGSRFGLPFSRFLVRMQDLEFMTTMSAMQMLREKTGSVGMGGNGQFTRMSALDEIARRYSEPWHGALLEDYELGLHILLVGYKNRFVYDTYVEQEGLLSLRRLLAQRTRWTQGTMQCSVYLRDIIASPNFTNAGVIESCYFLVTPWLQVIGVFLWPILLLFTLVQAFRYPSGAGDFFVQFWPLALITVIFGALPFVMWGPIYRRNVEPTMSRSKAWLFGLGNALFLYYTYASTPRAFTRIVLRRRGWAKTRRNAEAMVRGPVASDV